MENKKTYKAPLAQIVLLAPSEAVSASFGKNNAWWNLDNSAWWGTRYTGTASVVTGGLGISDEDNSSWKYDDNIN